MNFDYDLFVIGAGSGGVRAARMSTSHGAKVAVAEEYRVGGTCVIRGCVPKKLFGYASHFAEEFEDAAGFGWTVADAKFDWATLVKNTVFYFKKCIFREVGLVLFDPALSTRPPDLSARPDPSA